MTLRLQCGVTPRPGMCPSIQQEENGNRGAFRHGCVAKKCGLIPATPQVKSTHVCHEGRLTHGDHVVTLTNDALGQEMLVDSRNKSEQWLSLQERDESGDPAPCPPNVLHPSNLSQRFCFATRGRKTITGPWLTTYKLNHFNSALATVPYFSDIHLNNLYT